VLVQPVAVAANVVDLSGDAGCAGPPLTRKVLGMSTVPSASTTTTTTLAPEATTPCGSGDHQQATVHRRLDVTGMTCSHCEHAIAAELRTVHGVVTVDVDAHTGIVVLGCSTEPNPAAVAAAIHDAGYDLR